jgi:hypothetical protein
MGNRAERAPFPLQHGQGVSFRLGELAVLQGSSLPGVIPFSLPARRFFLGRRRCCTYFVNLRGLTIRSSRNRFVTPKAWQKKLAMPLAPLRGSA